MELDQPKLERKPHKQGRSGHNNPRPSDPRHGRTAKSAQPTPETRFAVYSNSGQERLGSLQRTNDATFIAFTRRGHLLGTFASEQAAVAAIERGAAP
jgi:hypothetical protein